MCIWNAWRGTAPGWSRGLNNCFTGRCHLAATPFYNGRPPLFLLFCDQKRSRKVPLLPRRGARLKGAWVRAAHERFASAPLRIQEWTHWPLPGANTLQLDDAKFLFFVSYFRSFVGGGVAGSRSDHCPSGVLNRTSGPALLDGGARCAPPSADASGNLAIIATFRANRRGGFYIRPWAFTST